MQTCAVRGCVAILIFTALSCALTDRPPGAPPGIAIAYQLLEDPAGTATIEQVAQGPLAERFRPSPERSMNLGLTSSVWWLRFALDETPPEASDPAILEVGWPLLEEATFFSLTPDGSFTARSAGLRVPIRAWEIDYRLPSFRVAPDTARTHYLRIASGETIILPLTLWTERGFEAKRRTETAVLGFYFGMLLVMAASGVLSYVLLREGAFLSYACLVASFALWQASLAGLLSTYVWPDVWWFGTRAMALFAIGTMISTIVFARAFLSSARYAPRLDRAARLAHPVLALFVLWALLWPGPALTYTATPFAMVAAVWMIATALVVARRGHRFAHYFLVTWLFALLSALVQGLRNLGLVDSNVLTDYGLQLGVALTFAALSFGLIGRIFSLRDDVHQLEREDDAKRTFLATASHDLRQPLHAISLLLGALRERLTDAQSLDLIDRILAATDEMAAMFNSLLDLSRLEVGTVRPRVTSFDLRPTFGQLEAEFGALASEKGLHLRVTSADVAVRSDPLLLSRILRNLLSNAIRYTRGGEVRLEARPVGEMIEIVVADTGRGIAEAEQDVVFEPYRRLDGASAAGDGGLGLGLTIVQRMSVLLGHALELESLPDRGTTFTLRLAAGEMRAAPASPATVRDEALSLAGLSVLVIDDDGAVRDGMRAQLQAWGCVVRTARSAEEAASVGAGGGAQLIVADYHVGDGANGLEVIAGLRRAAGRDIPAVLVTADTSAGVASEARAAGMIVLTKPVAPARLRTVVNRICRLALRERARDPAGTRVSRA